MKKENFKLDEEMIGRIEAFAAKNNLTKSSAIRLLLARALGDDVENAYVSEIVLRIQNVVRGNVGKMLARWEKELVTMLSQTLELSREELEAQMPPDVTEYEREAVRARSPQPAKPAPAPVVPTPEGYVPAAPAAKPPRAPRPAPEAPETGTVEFIEEDEGENEAEEPVGTPETGDDARLALLDELEDLFWENYRSVLSEKDEETGEPVSPGVAAQGALDDLRRFRREDIEKVGWQAPVPGTEDFEARKAKHFPQGGVRGRRR